MKKISFICVVVAMLSLTACSNDAKLRERVTCLEEQVQTSDTVDIDDAKGVENVIDTEKTDIQEYLNQQIELNNSNSMLEVAKCDEATEEHLMLVAQYCIDYGHFTTAETIVKELVNNSNCTSVVMEKLAESDWHKIIEIVATSDKSSEKALVTVAQYCVDYGHFTTAETIVKELVNNSNCTSGVMEKLAESDWYKITEIVATSDKSSEKALVAVAQYCVDYGHFMTAETIVKELVNNSNCTSGVMEKLAESDWHKIIEIVATSDKSSEKALVAVAQYCIDYGRFTTAETIAKELVNNSNCTGVVMEKLAESDWYKIIEIVAVSDKSSEKALVAVAQYCVDYGHLTTSEIIANKLVYNPNCTANVVKNFAEATSSMLVHIGHVWIEEHS